MKLFLGILLSSLFFLSACVGQAQKTHRLFQKENIGQHRLAESMEALKVLVQDEDPQGQMHSIRALRHIEKYNSDASRRNQALKALAVTSVTLEQSKAQQMSLSRLMLRLKSKDLQANLQVIDAIKEAATGRLGMLRADHSLFKEQVTYQFIPLSKEEREKAVQILEDSFLDLPLINQQEMARAFGEILANPTRCLEYKTEKKESCISHDFADQQGFKQGLIAKIGSWLQGKKVAPLIQVELILAVEQTRGTADPKIVESTFYKWSEDKEMPRLAKLLTGAGFRKVTGDFEEIFTPTYRAESKKSVEVSKISWGENKDHSSTEVAAKLKSIRKKQEQEARKFAASNFISTEDYRDPAHNISRPYWLANAEAILFYQLFKSEQAGAKEVPEEWIFSRYYKQRSEAIDQRTILYTYSRKALRSGFLLQGKRPLLGQLLKYIPSSEKEHDDLEIDEEEATAVQVTPLELKVRFQMALLSLPSLKANGENPKALLNQIDRSFYKAKKPFDKNLYLQMLHGLNKHFPKVAHKMFCKAFKSLEKGEQILALQEWSEATEGKHCGVEIAWAVEGYQNPKNFIPAVLSEEEMDKVVLNKSNFSTEEPVKELIPEDKKAQAEKAGSVSQPEPVTSPEASSQEAPAAEEEPWYQFW